MCSKAGQLARSRSEAETAARLAAAIEDLAAAADAEAAGAVGAAGRDVTSRLAQAWAMIAAADPDLAARTAGYSGSA